MRRLLVIASTVFLAAACGPSTQVAPRTPEPEPAVGPPPGAPPAEPAPRFTEIPAAPESCAAIAAAPATVACADRAAALAALAGALESPDHTVLAGLESCAALEPGIIRALRADLAPAGCADVLTDSAIGEDSRLRREVRDAIVGLGIAAKLSRLVRTPPVLATPYDKALFMEFFKGDLVPWIAGQARAIFALSSEGAKLRGYGQGIVAVEAGLAEMRFVEVARGIPLPEEMASDAELKEIYYAALDEALEPRKVRGRDAALVGLRRFAELGVLRDARVDQARALLSDLFGGRRIDALDALLVPPPKQHPAASVEHRLAGRIPTFYVGYLLPDLNVASAEGIASLVESGLPPPILERLRSTPLNADATKLLSRGFFRLGQRYWRADDFRAAVTTLAPLTSAKKRDEEARFFAALSEVLAAGPRDAAEMMLKGPQYPAGIGNVEPLDRIAKEKGPYAGLAAFDAAYVLRLVPPMDQKPEYFDDIARRFREAAPRLDKEVKARAEELAKAAEDTAKAVRDAAPAPGSAAPAP